MTSIALPSEGSSSSLRTHDFDDPIRKGHGGGPNTAAGKARSSQNARKHNLTAATPPPDLAEHPDFQALISRLQTEWRPFSHTQELLVRQLALTSWQLDQVPQVERRLLATDPDAADPATPPPYRPLDAQPEDAHPGHVDPCARRDDPTPAVIAQHLLRNEPTPLTRLWDHHRRLLGRCQSLIRQLQSLAKAPPRPTEDLAKHRETPAILPLQQMTDEIHERNRARLERERIDRARAHDQAQQRANAPQSAPNRSTTAASAQNELPAAAAAAPIGIPRSAIGNPPPPASPQNEPTAGKASGPHRPITPPVPLTRSF